MTIGNSFKRRAAGHAAAALLALLTGASAQAGCSDPARAGVDWPMCDKSGANLPLAYLWAAMLTGTNFAHANLGGANLMSAYMVNANLTLANLLLANLFRADLRGANLEGANLGAANLMQANLTGANLTGANLKAADLTGAIWTDGRTCKLFSIGKCL